MAGYAFGLDFVRQVHDRDIGRRGELAERGRDILRLDREQHDVARAPRKRFARVRHRGSNHEHFLRRFDAETALADGGELRPAREEHDISVRARETTTDDAADRAHAEDHGSHATMIST